MGKTKLKPVEDVNSEVVDEVEKAEEVEEQRNDREQEEEQKEEEAPKSFEELGLDSRLIRALTKKGIEKPTLIQQSAIPYILEGKDVVARAKTGSGKTLAYLLPLLQKLFSADSVSKKKLAPSAFILVPSRELCQQVYTEVSSLIELCRVQLKAVQLTSSMSASDMRNALAGLPEILVSTPACIPKCFAAGVLEPTAVSESLSILVLDEADLLLSYGYEDNLRSVTSIIPRRCQCLLMSATTSSDVEKLKKLILHNPIVLTLTEDNDKEEAVPSNVQQFWISCSAQDKLLHILALLKLEVVQKKILIFINTIDMGFRLKLFLEKFGIKSAILNGELPQNSRLHILEQFNAGLFDYLIATDDNSQTKKQKEEAKGEANKENKKNNKRSKPKLDAEFGVVRGIDFKKVHTVINFDMPQSVTGYIHRIGRTGRAYSSGSSVSLISPDEMEGFEDIKSFLASDKNKDIDIITPFPLLTENAVESLRYRAEDVAKSVTKIAVRESRAQDLRNEIINSEKLKAHFEANPRDLDLLRHDKPLSKTAPAPHLKDIPEYLVDAKTQEASKMVKLARAAMGNTRRSGGGGGRNNKNKKRSRKGSDPLKTFNPNGSKRGAVGQKDGKDSSSTKKQKTV
ncbi:RNA helicase (RH16) [Arabidopsis thaliana]|uniref:DEAD-box ATP-dependent RNA helicase 16 n=2 Tax=Arabidopsis thaliana TaxID=3702 RepID=RH16_ARATH|nr:P-loop containing nucleoside triphosphate hydrolases superfamily protein [Arabidopsis thaliana]Q9SW44.1 RecName: Full=DEAD-box ATP-dependent RNA helicase 16 [Arabidopsis thaliana]AAO22635.1 putative DEAD/DEAH box RNA helicase protein [Arabidopsis thaliana]AAO42436.1 putative DEAD/DEAH box RNA helicase protein [Arabidopsis thaliana]AEE86436.1 P-loop containing nucleoside triphosphate hydrolases superfamily protein [Arabidopsis thaliana]CAB45452.1 RNA helicase (RH16) [Arabidopsis thaliana]CA|eukprot:NP_195217.1 P-loop containing nucleoside triphosphate hydrolases superfamily protein [Arabidopsis thaliana]